MNTRSVRLNSRAASAPPADRPSAAGTRGTVRARRRPACRARLRRVRSGTVISRTSESSTSAAALRPTGAAASCPGGASNDTRAGDGGRRHVARRGHASAEIRRAVGRDGRERRRARACLPARAARPACCGTGSQTNVTRVLPFSPRSVPIQVRTTRARDGVVMAASAVSHGLRRLRLRRRQRARRFLGGERPVALARADLHAGPLHPHLDLVELAVGRGDVEL